ncbi:16S rRNA m(7)G-527 methyltransferase [Thiogranum longum]|uniref:Ribosomal RNA small subunit methyltransferase G n=1 Tax=Thiogranum longum TaxID=1537524 RepID=A0A4R1H9W0_9GAMM|nr:16S rRNA (guanine(527)-N(7))-methyltransferase RsmG [Thiogranum longum]TCK16910.1 16S rRNA m(7)G-527 methyltransferase [Thiogranum longum]
MTVAGNPARLANPAIEAEIVQGTENLPVELESRQVNQLATLVGLLAKWNQVYNLTAVRDPQDMVARHILDSLVVTPYLRGSSLLDVGTGAGLPGLPLAVARPELHVTLLDSSDKKLRFIRQAVAELNLENVTVVHSRMQAYQPAQAFDMVISRAVSSLAELYRMTRHLVRDNGRFLFMKGARPNDELDNFERADQLQIERLQVPGLDAERHLLILDNSQSPVD